MNKKFCETAYTCIYVTDVTSYVFIRKERRKNQILYQQLINSKRIHISICRNICTIFYMKFHENAVDIYICLLYVSLRVCCCVNVAVVVIVKQKTLRNSKNHKKTIRRFHRLIFVFNSIKIRFTWLLLIAPYFGESLKKFITIIVVHFLLQFLAVVAILQTNCSLSIYCHLLALIFNLICP